MNIAGRPLKAFATFVTVAGEFVCFCKRTEPCPRGGGVLSPSSCRARDGDGIHERYDPS
jgi:hypothetical protein